MHPECGGMTTKERLFAAKLLDAFGETARKRGRQEMLRLLIAVEPDPKDAASLRWSVARE